jgi:hypothetical protein
MDMMTLTQLAQRTDLAPPTVRRYLDDFILYVPTVRVDQTLGFPPDAVSVMRTIHTLTESGHSHSEILTTLQDAYPVTVVSSQPLLAAQPLPLPSALPVITSLLQAVDDRYAALVGEIDVLRNRLELSDQTDLLATVPADLAEIRRVIAMLAKRIPARTTHQEGEMNALREEIAYLRRDLGELRAEREQISLLIAEIRHALLSPRTGDETAPAPHLVARPTHSPATSESGRAGSPRRLPRRLGHTTAR